MISAFSRAGTVVVLGMGLFAVLPFRRDVAFFRRLGMVLFAAVCWRSSRQLLWIIPAPSQTGRNAASGDCLSRVLPPGTIAGYVGRTPEKEIAVDYGFRPRERSRQALDGMFDLVEAEAAAAPIVVVNRHDAAWVVVDRRAALAPDFQRTHRRIDGCRGGLALYGSP